MTKNYAYPLDLSWSTEELSTVLSFLNQVENAYETRADAARVLETYAAFKAVVKSKGQEKQIDREFELASGYSTYRTVQAARAKGKGVIRLGR